MSRNTVVWWEINARDGRALTEFYRDILDWDCLFDEPSGIWNVGSGGDGGDGSIAGGIFTGKGRLPPHRCLYVQVDDIHGVTAKVEARGLPILQGPFETDGGSWLAFFRDPEGHMIGLLQRTKRE